MGKKLLAVLVLLVLIGLAAFVAVKLAGRGEPEEQVMAPTPLPLPTPTPTPSPLEGVTLADSDPIVRDLAAGLGSSDPWRRILAQDDLIRRFVASVAMVARGKSPRRFLTPLRPSRPFRVRKRGGKLVAAPSSFRRYDAVVDMVVAMDPTQVAELYRQLKPLIDEAYAEISKPGDEFDEVLEKAIVHLLKTPVVQGLPKLKEKVVTYAYVDPRLEGLSDAQRHLLRLGPENAARIQDWLRRLAVELGIPPDRLPEPETLTY